MLIFEEGAMKVIFTVVAVMATLTALPTHSAEIRQTIQACLAVLGHDPGSADGIFGQKTRAAIRSWQQSQELEPSGFIEAGQGDSILSECAAVASGDSSRKYGSGTRADENTISDKHDVELSTSLSVSQGEIIYEAGDFSGKDLSDLSFSLQYAARAKFVNSNLSGSDFADSNLFEADFTNADLRNVNFDYAYLKGAILTGAVLTGASLKGAVLDEANLLGAKLTAAQLAESIWTGAEIDEELKRQLASIQNNDNVAME